MNSDTEENGESNALPWWRHTLRWLILAGLSIVMLYTWGAVFYDGPFATAGVGNGILATLWLGATIAGCILLKRYRYKLAAIGASLLVVFIPWSFIEPSNDRDWQDCFAETGHTSIVQGGEITFYNLRNFDYTEEGEEIVRWETRTVQLSNLRGVDLFHDTFFGDVIAHPILSFDFGPDGRICLSIETRREEGEVFSVFGGLYKMFELQYVFSTEEDVIRVRTNIRKEPVYHYPLKLSQQEILLTFLSSVEAQNQLYRQPKFYNVISSNCTTSLRAQRPDTYQEAFDHRMLLNGLLDEYLYEQGVIESHGLSFRELRERCYITEVAQQFHHAEDFSAKIREGRPGSED